MVHVCRDLQYVCVFYTHIHGLNNLQIVQKHFRGGRNKEKARILYTVIKKAEYMLSSVGEVIKSMGIGTRH
jgi:hypothetical protein